ncbi:hypothetical protein MHYP_G00078210 [Metynnis hypsauchen]
MMESSSLKVIENSLGKQGAECLNIRPKNRSTSVHSIAVVTHAVGGSVRDANTRRLNRKESKAVTFEPRTVSGY